MKHVPQFVRRTAQLAGACMLLAAWSPLAAQDPAQVLNLGAPAGDTLRGAAPDSVLTRIIARFNDPRTTRLEGKLDLAPGASMGGTLALYGNIARIQGTVRGSVIILNGDLRISATGRVEGEIIVVGGRLTVAPGGVITGDTTVYERAAPVSRAPDGTVVRGKAGRSLTDFTTASASFALGPVATTLHAGAGTYNRTEGLPIRVGPSFLWRPGPKNTLQLDLNGVFRTASSSDANRPDVGWSGALTLRNAGKQPLSFRVDGGSVIAPMTSRAYSPLESGLSAFLLRRDYRDWFATRGWGLTGEWSPTKALSVSAGVQQSRERSVRATEAFSVFRSGEAWRANPLIDEGRFQTASFGLGYDTRDDKLHPTSGWWLRSEIRRVTSNELTPASLPVEIRGAMPVSGYQSDQVDFDARYYLRLNPRNSVHLRAAGGGWIGGDPLLVQQRRAMGGGDPMAGYGFRFLNCDRRLRPDAAEPALCDRELLLQGEFRRTLELNFNTRVGGYAFGIQRADLVLFGDVGTAWLAGPGRGQVPSNRIQTLGEWRSDVGAGFDAGHFGIYLAKAIADPESVRLLFRLQRRF
ncbi:MAG: BamA/TamA family outer membrane protein [Gemmatimonadales bacterium]